MNQLNLLALGIAYWKLGRVMLDYPGSSTSSPAPWVVVNLNVKGPLRSGDRGYFPYRVAWSLWEDTIADLLENEENPKGQLGIEDLITYWEGVLGAYLDESIRVLLEGEQDLSGTIVSVESGVPTLDNELAWVEGHPRKDYPAIY